MGCYLECTRTCRGKVIAVCEGRRTAAILNNAKEPFKVTRFDGCVDCEGKRADFVINCFDNRRVIVELKGRQIEDAGPQIENTLSFLARNGLVKNEISALVVCSKVPLGVSSVQRLAATLKTAGISRVKVKTGKWVGHFNDLFC